MKKIYDAVVIGGGPAGLSAAIYLARAEHSVLVIEKDTIGGQISITDNVVNYPAIKSINGKKLAEDMKLQAENFGAEFLFAEVTDINMSSNVKYITTTRGVIECLGVIYSAGARPRRIGFDGEEDYRGKGISYCATCDGEFFTDKEIFVIGGSYSAAQESIFLSKYASHITVLMRRDSFTCAESLAEKVRQNDKITVLTNTEVVGVSGDSRLRSISYRNNRTGKITEYSAPDGDTLGVFVFAGYQPETELLAGKISIDDNGYILTDREQRTSVEGMYAAGDVCAKTLRQVVTAVSDGAVAANSLQEYLSEIKKESETEKSEGNKMEAKNTTDNIKNTTEYFDDDTFSQLHYVFDRMENFLELKLFLDSGKSSRKLKEFIQKLSDLTSKITVSMGIPDEETDKPCVKIYKDKEYTGLAFHGVPLGHELNSFIMAIYNVSGKGQDIDEQTLKRIQSIDKPLDIKIMVTLSCSMCPELVVAAQKIASINKNVTAEIYDLADFPAKIKKYNIMGVPMMLINDSDPIFGKKSLFQLLDIIEEI